eukprot:CAMPEP_0119353872 /NCGR_PEP_ID=MMETSP1334-20130426/2968_1 /TAXON_ID=127549 /ORGANISM="Calcidiscus leptoporus, Strain RCC1130" /LENGTH=35 /DNA_ID= /DNA_START= /DNA_END= /DNA_ORIENTATION=
MNNAWESSLTTESPSHPLREARLEDGGWGSAAEAA